MCMAYVSSLCKFVFLAFRLVHPCPRAQVRLNVLAALEGMALFACCTQCASISFGMARGNKARRLSRRGWGDMYSMYIRITHLARSVRASPFRIVTPSRSSRSSNGTMILRLHPTSWRSSLTVAGPLFRMYWRINSVMRFKLSATITTSGLISTASPVAIKNRNACCETESGASCFREGGSNGLAASAVRSFVAAA
jgi:hypothetical protein